MACPKPIARSFRSPLLRATHHLANGDRYPSHLRFLPRTRLDSLRWRCEGGNMSEVTPPSPQPAAPQNGLGTAALVLGIVQFFCFPLIGGVLAIVFGKMGMAKAEQGLATNGGAAKAGFILGIVGLALWVLLILITLISGMSGS
ncbi:MAG: DUF4190 domain-containing protein [Candidatus Nanopelagicales bacterium]|nr:DUF4190 domain-containing protein [Candidatus Nanopelagicales bacterium]